MCDQHVSHQGQPNFADMANIEASLAQPALSGADGIVLWGSSRPAPADDKHAPIVATASVPVSGQLPATPPNATALGDYRELKVRWPTSTAGAGAQDEDERGGESDRWAEQG